MDWQNTIKQSKPQDIWFDAHGCMIHGHQWNYDESITTVLIHGSLANNVWWQHIGSAIQKGRVLSIDLSGHGLSEKDSAYSLEKHAQEVIALIDEFGVNKVVLVGHSYGGIVASYVATKKAIEKVVLLDTPLNFSDVRLRIKPKKVVYATMDEAVSHFRSLPVQPVSDQALLEWVAQRSLEETEGGYVWQFDPKTLEREIKPEWIEEIKKRLKGVHWWYGEHSPFIQGKAVADDLGMRAEMIAGAYHAVTLDSPEIVINKITKLIEELI